MSKGDKPCFRKCSESGTVDSNMLDVIDFSVIRILHQAGL